MLCQAHGGEERNSCNTVASLKINEPSPLLLEYTFTRQSVPLKNSIQAGLGGVRLKPTIKQPHKVVTDFCNLIAVKEYKTHTVDVSDFGVCRLPITFGSDGSIHLGFDFAHQVLRLVDLLSMAGLGGKVNPLTHKHFLCCLEPAGVEVGITEDLTIDQLKHTKLIGHHITFGINPVVVDVCCRTIIAAEVYCIFFDRLDQLPETDKVGGSQSHQDSLPYLHGYKH